jgi:predicted Rossmann fold flavoprotein
MENYDILVLGAGPAGMTAAISAAMALNGQHIGGKIALIDGNSMVGKKLSITGNGRCNFANEAYSEDVYRGKNPAFADRLYKKMGCAFVLDFMKKIGVYPKKQNGCYYPNSGQAQSVVKLFDAELYRLGIKTYLLNRVTGIERMADSTGFIIHTDVYDADSRGRRSKKINASMFGCRKLIMAMGGLAAPDTGSDGIWQNFAENFGMRIIKPLPALCALYSKQGFIKDLAGVRAMARAVLFCGSESPLTDTGEIIFSENGVSGIPIMSLSAYASRRLWEVTQTLENPDILMKVDFLPDLDNEETMEYICSEQERKLHNVLCGMLNEKLALVIEKLSGVPGRTKARDLLDIDKLKLLVNLKSMRINIDSTAGFNASQVTSGGICVDEIDEGTMQSSLVKNLYLAGEMLDIDAACGGYNITFAMETGYIAGMSAARSLYVDNK